MWTGKSSTGWKMSCPIYRLLKRYHLPHAPALRVTLTYAVGTDMDKALTLLLTKLSGITNLPDEAKAPQVRTSNSDDSPIARLALTHAGHTS